MTMMTKEERQRDFAEGKRTAIDAIQDDGTLRNFDAWTEMVRKRFAARSDFFRAGYIAGGKLVFGKRMPP